MTIIGPIICLVVLILILVVGGVLNSKSDSDELSDSDSSSEMSLSSYNFNRVSATPVCLQMDADCNVDDETVAEIVYASEDGNMIAYTDGTMNRIGFMDITDPSAPTPGGVVDVGGESTSLVIKGKYVIVGVATSESYVLPSGNLQVIDMETKAVVATLDMMGQPDAVALSPDGNFVAVAIENERDEDLGDGVLPQLPAGHLMVVDSSDEDPTKWTATKVEMTGLEGIEESPEDPEPEFVAINEDNIAVVTLQENNGIVLVDLATLEITASFSAGTVTLEMVDVMEEGIINPTGMVKDYPREPDGVTWIGTDYFATANEGDMNGGTRGFTIFDTSGGVVYDSGNTMEHVAIQYGHYPDERSENKGNEPENVLYAEFGDFKLLFVGSERSSLVFVYDVEDVSSPKLHQVLPVGGVGPEGKFAIPSRNLLLVAAENDERDAKMRSAVNIYELQEAKAMYPTIISDNGPNGYPIPFSALSGLAYKDGMLYSVEDSFYKKSRMFVIDPSNYAPAVITDAVMLLDQNEALIDVLEDESLIPAEMIEPAVSRIMNVDRTVNLDLEGIAAVEDGFWVVSEGRGTVNDTSRPLEMPNLLLHVDTDGIIQKVVTLPLALNQQQLRFGFEGVAVDGDNVVVAFQRAWAAAGDTTSARLGIYNTVSETWKFVYYPLDTPESLYGGWVGLSDITSLGEGKFYVLERDNQGGPDGVIKRVYEIDLGDYSMAELTVVTKTLVRDLVPDILSYGGQLLEKVEGMAVDSDGNLWINNDNDGVDDNSGEQLLIKIEL